MQGASVQENEASVEARADVLSRTLAPAQPGESEESVEQRRSNPLDERGVLRIDKAEDITVVGHRDEDGNFTAVDANHSSGAGADGGAPNHHALYQSSVLLFLSSVLHAMIAPVAPGLPLPSSQPAACKAGRV